MSSDSVPKQSSTLGSWLKRDNLHYYLMFLPALLLLIGIMYPFAVGFVTSLTNEKLYLPTAEFIGLQNYQFWLGDALFWESLRHTAFYVLAVLIVQIPLGVLVAVILDVATPVRTLFRSTLVLPLLIPPIVAGLMWKTMMQPAAGILNWLITSVGLQPFPWLSDTSSALISIVLIDTWVFMPFSALIILAGLQALPTDILEAAKVDGASEWAVFRTMKLPWVTPYILLVMLFRTADAIKAFDLIYPTTRGGPINATRVLHVLAYQEAFRWSNTGRAMAILIILWVISYVASTFLTRFWRKRSEAIQGGL